MGQSESLFGRKWPFLLAVAILFLLSVAQSGLAFGEQQDGQDRGVLVIVHTDALSDAAIAWEQYRSGRGWIVHRLNTADVIVTASQSAVALDHACLREKIRGVLRGMYGPFEKAGHGGERFAVLLLGDAPDHGARFDGLADFIPMWYRDQRDRMLIGRDGLADIATDHDYQLVDDTDDLPDFALGRVPARSNAEALIVLNKIKRYESTEANAGAWRKHIAYFASEGRFGPLDGVLEQLFKQMVDQVVPYDNDISMAYAKVGSPYAPPFEVFTQTVIDRINAGALLVNYLGHGQARMLDRWHVGGRSQSLLQAEDVARIRPEYGRNPIMLFIACWTGQVDRPGGERSLAEELLLTEGGAIAVIAGSRITHPLPSGVYQRHFSEVLLSDHPSTLGAVDLHAARRLAQGDAIDEQLDLLASPVAFMQKWDTSPADLRPMHMALYNLLGDPALEIALPRGRVEGLNFAMSDSGAQVSGSIGAGFVGTVTVTIEARRTMIALRSTDDTRRLDERANDKVLLRVTVPGSKDGSFAAEFDREQLFELSRRYRGQLVLKVAALGAIEGTGPIDAIGHLMLTLPE